MPLQSIELIHPDLKLCLGKRMLEYAEHRDHSKARESREVILRIAAAHKDKRALEVLGMELAYVHLRQLDLTIVCYIDGSWNNGIVIRWSSETFSTIRFVIRPYKSFFRHPDGLDIFIISRSNSIIFTRLSRCDDIFTSTFLTFSFCWSNTSSPRCLRRTLRG
jgi:hypothetical protein